MTLIEAVEEQEMDGDTKPFHAHIPEEGHIVDWNKPLSEEEISEFFKVLEKQQERLLKVHQEMIPYSLMAINGIIDNELWSKIYKSLRESFGNEK